MKRLFSFLFLIIGMTVFSLFLLSVSKDPLSPAKNEKIAHAGYESGQDLSRLALRFGASVPYYSTFGSGQVTDSEYPGGVARIFTWFDSSGCTVKAVRPANAAALLREDAFSPAGKCYLIGDMTAAVFEGELKNALYFGNTDAAYAVIYDAARSLESLGVLQFTD
ncbi:MAG: hypothetical protein IKW00_08710 [Clostridia bacterium]|nr:hypothetical protein [Clostridia bacterium]